MMITRLSRQVVAAIHFPPHLQIILIFVNNKISPVVISIIVVVVGCWMLLMIDQRCVLVMDACVMDVLIKCWSILEASFRQLLCK